MSLFFSNQTKFTLVAPVRIDDLGIVSATFKFIKPSNTTGEFVATLDSDNNQITYDTTGSDINEQGVWKIWATFTDSNGRFNRAKTAQVEFKNENG